MIRTRSGFTLVEFIASAVTIGILGMMMYSIFLGAWINFEMELTRIHMGNKAAQILRIIEEDALEAKELAINDGNLTMAFPDPLRQDPDSSTSLPILGSDPNRGNFSNTNVTYQRTPPSLTRIGDLTGTKVLSRMIDPATNFQLEGSSTATNGRRVLVNLVFLDHVFGMPVSYQQSKEIMVRNPQ